MSPDSLSAAARRSLATRSATWHLGGLLPGSLVEGHEPHQRRPTRYFGWLIWRQRAALVSVSGAPPTPRRAGPVSSGSSARAPVIFSQACLPPHGRHGRIRGRRAARRGRRAIPSAFLIVGATRRSAAAGQLTCHFSGGVCTRNLSLPLSHSDGWLGYFGDKRVLHTPSDF